MDHSTSASLNSLIDEVLQFHDQEVFASVEQGISSKKWHFRVIFATSRILAQSRVFNALILAVIILVHPVFRWPSDGFDVFEFDPNGHNLRSFDRVNVCLPKYILARISINGEQPTLFDRVRAVSSAVFLWQAAGILKVRRTSRALPHLQAAIAIGTYLLYRNRPLPDELNVLLVANDHSPVCLTLLFLARRQGVRTCYIQHAPVTEHFPPLAYDLAILYDKASAQAYERAAHRTGTTVSTRIVYLPPFPREFEPPHLGPPPYVVGICLSFLPQVPRLAALIDEVAAHPSVNRVILRKHPRCTLDLSRLTRHPQVSLQPGDETADAFFDQVDVVLVPNSGVTIEALHRGRPTFFTPGADDLPEDYYGFVATGLLPEFHVDLLDDRETLLAFFDVEWQLRFGEQDETVHTSLDTARNSVREAFMDLM